MFKLSHMIFISLLLFIIVNFIRFTTKDNLSESSELKNILLEMSESNSMKSLPVCSWSKQKVTSNRVTKFQILGLVYVNILRRLSSCYTGWALTRGSLLHAYRDYGFSWTERDIDIYVDDVDEFQICFDKIKYDGFIFERNDKQLNATCKKNYLCSKKKLFTFGKVMPFIFNNDYIFEQCLDVFARDLYTPYIDSNKRRKCRCLFDNEYLICPESPEAILKKNFGNDFMIHKTKYKLNEPLDFCLANEYNLN